MNFLANIAVVSLTVLLAACGPHSSSEGQARSDTGATKDPLAIEGKQFILATFDQVSLRCGDEIKWFYEGTNGFRIYYFVKGLDFDITPIELSPADRMNGIEFRGILTYNDPGIFKYVHPTNPRRGWENLSEYNIQTRSGWQGKPRVVEKIHGEWNLSQVGFDLDMSVDKFSKPADCGSASRANNDPQIQLTGWDASRNDIQRTNSGLQYVVNVEGPRGGQKPSEQDRVEVMYEGRLADGTVFDSSYARGSTSAFRVNQVISGWTEGLQLMSEGDEFVFYIPSELGYGQNPRPGSAIKPGDDLIFRVELRKVVKAPEPRSVDVEAWATYMPWDSSREDVQKTASGLEYVVLADGKEGGLTPKPTDKVEVYYEGRFANTDEVFDSAYQRGEAATFPANGLIPGWVEALSMMKPGARWLVYIPSNLAYGKEGGGSIPPNADLVFEVELLEVL